ncbi:HAMP domain-containing sensor histidine kinase [Brevibacillus migulae]|uniref:HAMP domain-containing sensor histidine kinase n=1 Tax=Brevibacillus migulae TaxID=1644114 RepID=UPI00106EE1E2|nr:sensor histidine kinase [Brevibacillus migulae]
MATKSKNKWTAFCACIVLAYSLALCTLSTSDVIRNDDYLNEKSYFESYFFTNEIMAFFELIKSKHFQYKDYPNKSLEKKIAALTEDDLQNLEFEISQMPEYQKKEEAILLLDQQLLDEELATQPEKRAQLLAEKTQKEAELALAKESYAELIKRDYVNAKEDEYEEIEKSLRLRSSSFKYSIEDHHTHEVYTNYSSGDERKSSEADPMYRLDFPQTSYQSPELQSINRFFQEQNWKGYILVPQTADGYSQVHADYAYFYNLKDRIVKECVIALVFLLISIGCVVFLRNTNQRDIAIISTCRTWADRIPFDFRIALFLFCGFMLLILITELDRFFYLPLEPRQAFILTFVAGVIAYLLAEAQELIRLAKDQEKWRQQWQSGFFYRLIRLVKDSFLYKSIFVSIVVFAGLTGFWGTLLGILVFRGDEEWFLLTFAYSVLYLLLVVPFVLKRVNIFNRILKGAEEIASGNFHYLIEAKGNGKLSELAKHMNEMRNGYREMLDQQIKSERLKSELITNVSHDLKTPLTSIINYIDLLGKKELADEEAKQYITVLDRKAARLKTLIDDLFEASKMASGSVELHMEKVNVVALLNQAIAECSDQIEASSLAFRVSTDKPKIHAYLDGKKTWRVFENLISNALKYSLPNTRVYVSVTEHADHVALTMQNVSAYELDFDVDEIFERFKRGDQSRHTEGSGLGLAIAKSIVELQGGELSIQLDGDMFKVMIVFRKS